MNLLAMFRRLAAIVFCLGAGITLARAQTSLPDAQVGEPYNYTVTTTPAAPAATVYGATGLPTGLSMNASSGQISGTPTAAGTFTGIISLTLNGVANNLSFSLVVDAALGAPAITSAMSASVTVGAAFDYLVEASNLPTSVNVGTLPAGLTFDAGTNRITGQPTSAGTFAVALSANNESGTGATATLTITVSPAGPVPVISSTTAATGTLVPASDPARYEVDYQITASNDPVSFGATGLPAGVSVDATTGAISGETTAQGIYSVTLAATNNNGTSPTVTLTLTIGDVSTISSTGPLSLTVGQSATFTLQATDNPESFNFGTLPPGLNGNGATGVISGTPTAAGSATVTVSANNAVGSGPEATITINIANPTSTGGGGGGGGGVPAPVITSATTAVAIAGEPFAFSVTASNSPTSYAATGLPQGLSINATTGAISGTTTVAGVHTVNVSATGAGGAGFAQLALSVRSRPSFTAQPQSTNVAIGDRVTLTASGTGFPTPTYQWQKNGLAIDGAVGVSLILNDVTPAAVGSYTVVITNLAGSATSAAALVGVTSTAKVSGEATVVGSDIEHPNGNIYDQVLMTGPSAAVTADTNQITRVSFIDLNDDIVQIELAGPGTLTVTLESASAPAAAAKYDQPGVTYVKGHPSIMISGATKDTHVTIFSVGTLTAINQNLFKPGENYDGIADVGLLAITSTDGKFGGIRTGNAHYFRAAGLTGMSAPEVEVTGPTYLHNVTADEDATPVLLFGATTDVQVTGGDLLQLNERAVQVDGITAIAFAEGSRSSGTLLPVQTNRARLERNGEDVTDELVP